MKMIRFTNMFSTLLFQNVSLIMILGAPQVHEGNPSAIWNLWKESIPPNHIKTKGISKKKSENILRDPQNYFQNDTSSILLSSPLLWRENHVRVDIQEFS